jgi:hypothetical protein
MGFPEHVDLAAWQGRVEPVLDQRRVVQHPYGGTAAAHAAGDAADGSPRRPSAVPARAARASTGGFRHRTSGVGIGAMAIASTSTSVRV